MRNWKLGLGLFAVMVLLSMNLKGDLGGPKAGPGCQFQIF